MIERGKGPKKGFRGWPLATVALYGPDDSIATKLTVGIVPAEDVEATGLRRWFSNEQIDIRDFGRISTGSGRSGRSNVSVYAAETARSRPQSQAMYPSLALSMCQPSSKARVRYQCSSARPSGQPSRSHRA